MFAKTSLVPVGTGAALPPCPSAVRRTEARIDRQVDEGAKGEVSRGLAVSLMGLGVAAVVAAGVVLMTQDGRALPAPARPVAAAAPASPNTITVSGPGDVTVVTQVYDPGQDSGWHAHPGIHAVAVLSGTLTVYDGQCRSQTFEAGRPYIGGQELHLARNETAVPVEMAVTYVSPSAPSNPTRHEQAPAGCQVGRPGPR